MIGYIPQQIYLFDGTVGENIIFGRKYDEQKAITALKKANVYDFLIKENGLETRVGEGGIRLSGGQMQRIAIARALYSNPEVLVLDEATSALDNKTETNIMNEIYNLNRDKTLIIIAHRLSTVLKCEKIYRVEDKNVFLVNKNEIYEKYIHATK
jgi:ABC-type multidrug transport system fused ATPase/permease subunit